MPPSCDSMRGATLTGTLARAWILWASTLKATASRGSNPMKIRIGSVIRADPAVGRHVAGNRPHLPLDPLVPGGHRLERVLPPLRGADRDVGVLAVREV